MSQNLEKNAGPEEAAVMPAGATAASPEQTHPSGPKNRLGLFGVCVFLALIVWVVFGQTSRFDFINFDDGVYIYKDPAVTHGLTLKGLEAAFSVTHSDNWVPLTTLSHELDCQLYGLNAGGHHVTNVLLQTAAAILLFLVLRQMTGFLWRSAFIAAVFAVHPLRAESVAWIAERKDVLSGVFFMLTLWAYVRYVCSATPTNRPISVQSSIFHLPSSFHWYLATLFLFALGLMSKPTLVTLPCVLLLLDYWPLRRLRTAEDREGGRRQAGRAVPLTLIVEKIPFFLLSIACCIATVISQRTVIQSGEIYPLHLRIENAIVSYVIQIERLFYPVNLALAYPYPKNGIPWWEAALAAGLLAGICVVVWAQRQKRPYLLVGWLWYLGVLVPNIGFIQAGDAAQADRYTYLPEIGLVLSLTWLFADRRAGIRPALLDSSGVPPGRPDACPAATPRPILALKSVFIIAVLAFYAHRQVAYWRNSETVWTHAAACTSGNYIAHNNLGDILMAKGEPDAAIEQYRMSLAANNPDPQVYHNLGNALLKQGDTAEAYADFQKALQRQPDFPEAYSDLGSYYLQEGQTDLAIWYFQKALQLQPAFPMGCYNLGNAYIQKGQMDMAVRYWQKAIDLQPDFDMAHNNLGNACMMEGHIAEAIQHWKAALKSQPDLSSAQMNLAWVLATGPDASLRDGPAALALAQQANQLSGGQNPMVLRILAAAYAENGQFPDAIAAAQQALQAANLQGNERIASSLQTQLQCYQNNRPFRDPGLTPK